MSGSMRGMWKRGNGTVTWAPPDERGGQQTNQTYCYRATFLLYRLPSADHEDSVTAFGLEQPVRPATAEAERQIQLNLSFRFFQPLTATDP